MTANFERDAERATSQDAARGSIPSDTFAARLVLVRHFAGRLSIEQAARRCNLNAGNWAHWEDGRRPRDQVEVARAIAESLDVDFNWVLLGGPLSGPRGMPTKRQKPLPREYREQATRPKPGRPNNRPTTGQRPPQPPRPEHRRPVRIDRPAAA